MKRAIVIGSGAGGATAARELQGGFDVTVLEAGRSFRPLALNLAMLARLRKTGLFFDERQIQWLFPTMRISRTPDLIMVKGRGLGGTTTLSAGNALRVDRPLQELGVDLDAEFAELYREIPVTTEHQPRWHPATRRLFTICREMDLQPFPTPKLVDISRCTNCGQCVLGCPRQAKWDSRRFLDRAVAQGARLLTDCQATKVVIANGKAAGVEVRKGLRRMFVPADLVVLAAGGMGTPVILQNSGISCEERLFVDPVYCVAAEWRDSLQNKEISMPFVVQREGYILSPYFDFLSFYFNKRWRFPAGNILSMMIKLADSNNGSVTRRGMQKTLTAADRLKLEEGVAICTEILQRMGIEGSKVFLGTLNAGHPGGMLPLTAATAESLHDPRLPENVYVADATLFPESLGNPPILTIMALAKRISKICLQNSARY